MNIRGVLVVTLIHLGLTVLTGGHGPAGFGMVSPLLPVAAITGHSGLLTTGLTGAALLKLKGAALIAYWLSVRKHKTKKGHGWGWRDDRRHKGHKGRGWGWDDRRHRRAVEVPEKENTPTIDKTLPADVSEYDPSLDEVPEGMSEYDPSLDEVLQYDQLGCGMRLVCELSATPDKSRMEDEKLILELFGRNGTVQNPERASRGKLSYSYAALLGSHSQDNNVCSNVYGRCPYSARQIMYSLRDMNI